MRERLIEYIALLELMFAQSPEITGSRFYGVRVSFVRLRCCPHYGATQKPDEVAQGNGWSFHTDGVHLNSRGGLIIADHVQEFIER